MCNHAHRHTLGVAPAGGTAFAPRRDDMETNAIAYAYCFRPDTRLGRRRDVRLQRRFRLRWGLHRSGLHDVSISEHVRSPYARIQTLHTAVHSRVLLTAATAVPCSCSPVFYPQQAIARHHVQRLWGRTCSDARKLNAVSSACERPMCHAAFAGPFSPWGCLGDSVSMQTKLCPRWGLESSTAFWGALGRAGQSLDCGRI